MAIGNTALNNVTTGSRNTAIGYGTLRSGNFSDNTAVGHSALISNTTGEINTAVGASALASNTSGDGNTATGWQALVSNTTGSANTATGTAALFLNTIGNANTAIGDTALQNNIAGSNNTAIGVAALFGSTGINNIALGASAGSGVTTADDVIAIGTPGADVSNSCYIGNIFGAAINAGTATQVGIDATGKLGTAPSARRFKKDIKPMDQASEAILRLKPVTFHYKSDTSGFPQFGLVAEEVAEVDPGLVVRDGEGEIFSVRYEAVNAMLLNEFLKEHRKVQELEATVAQQQKESQSIAAQQQKEIKALATALKEQASQIQKVSAELKMSKPAPQTVLNNQ